MIYEAILIRADGTDEAIGRCPDPDLLAYFCREALERIYGLYDDLAIDDGTVFKHPRSPHIETPKADIIIREII